MTFIVPRKLLVTELALLQTITERKATIPVLSMVRFNYAGEGDTLNLTATNLDTTLVTQVEASGEAYYGCVPLGQLVGLVRLLESNEVTFKPQPNRLAVIEGKSKHLLPTMPITEFPDVEQPAGDDFTLQLAPLVELIEATSFAIMEPSDVMKADDHRFTGLSLRASNGTLEVMATRKYVTAAAELPCDVSDFTAIIPRQAVNALLKVDGEQVAVTISESQAKFTIGSRALIARLLIGEFPQWRQFLPDLPHTLKVDAPALATAIKRATITMGKDNAVGYEPMKATFTADSITVETRDDTYGQSVEQVAVESNLNGDSISVGFISEQLLSVLGQCEGEVECSLASGQTPLLIKPSDGYHLITMPVRLKW